MKIDRLATIRHLSKKKSAWVHDELFRLFQKEELWILAYKNLKKNNNYLTPESDLTDTLSYLPLERLQRLKKTVCSEKYIFKPVQASLLTKPDGRQRLVELPLGNDKIVQETIRIILEAIYEPVFVPVNFGFRQGKGCHDALKHIENRFCWVDWVIEEDSEQAYSMIDHHVLVKILSKRIKDPRFLNLIRKLLKSGILEYDRLRRPKLGQRPQKSIVSSILVNIYYHELDVYIAAIGNCLSTTPSQKQNPLYKALEPQTSKPHPNYSSLLQSSKARAQSRGTKARAFVEKKESLCPLFIEDLKTPTKSRQKVSSFEVSPIRIEYVRYADDWMVGIAGNKKLADQVKQRITEFTLENFKLCSKVSKQRQKIHPIQTKITNFRKGNVHFLGYDIFLLKNRRFTKFSGARSRTIRRTSPTLRFDIPVRKLTKRYTEKGYLMQTSKGIRPISRASYAQLEDHVIVNRFRSLVLGIQAYYSGTTKPGKLQYIQYLLQLSCAMTLGHRHRMTCSQIFSKYGKNLKVKIPNTETYVEFPLKKDWSLSKRQWQIGRVFKDFSP